MASGSSDTCRIASSLPSASHQDLLSNIAFGFSSQREELSIAFKEGAYVFRGEHQEYLLPMTNLEARELILQFVPSIDKNGLQLLLTMLTHRSWKP